MNNSNSTQIRFILTTLRKRKWAILFLTGLVTLVAAAIVYSIQPTYRAASSIVFDLDADSTVINIEELVALDGDDAEYVSTQIEILRSNNLINRLVQELDLQNHWNLNDSVPTPASFLPTNAFSKVFSSVAGLSEYLASVTKGTSGLKTDESGNSDDQSSFEYDAIANRKVVELVASRTRVLQVKGTNLVKISFDSADPQLAALVSNKLADLYLMTRAEQRSLLVEGASTRLQERQEEIKEKLDESEVKLLQFREANNLISFRGNVSALNEQQLSTLTQELFLAENELKRAELLIDKITAARETGISGLAQISQIGGDPGVIGYLSEFQQRQRELADLSDKYLERHPLVIRAQSNVDLSFQNYAQQVLAVARSLEQEYSVALAAVQNLESKLNVDKAELQSLGRKQIELLELEREVAVNSDLYEKFFNRVRETEESRGLAISNAAIADPAIVPLAPVKPRKAIIIGTVFLLGLLGFGSCSFAFEEYKDLIQGTNDVEKKLGFNVLGVIPTLKGFNSSESFGHSARLDPSGIFLESMRTLRTSLRMNKSHAEDKIVMITSALPSEGKSTVAMYLALSFSRHQRTLLIEADIRKPGITEALALKGPGLVDVLARKEKLSRCIVTDKVLGVDVLSAGVIDAESADFLADEAMAALMRILTQHYDRIIIDTAPVEAVSDALILGELADSTIFVVKAESTTSVEAKRSLERLKMHGQNVLGVVISQVDFQKVTKYGGDFYYGGYFDKYGYGDTRSGLHRVA